MLHLISCLLIVRLPSLVGFMCNRSSVLPLQTRVLEERFAPHRIWSIRCELSEYENDYAHRNQQRTPTFGLARMVVDLQGLWYNLWRVYMSVQHLEACQVRMYVQGISSLVGQLFVLKSGPMPLNWPSKPINQSFAFVFDSTLQLTQR